MAGDAAGGPGRRRSADVPGRAAAERRRRGQALVVVTFEDHALAIVREAIDEGIYARFVFADAAKRVRLVREIGGAIRDHLREVGSPPGQVVLGTPGGVADALRLLAEGRHVDYEGVATTLDWDEQGDLREGYIGVWRFTADEGIEEVETVFFRD